MYEKEERTVVAGEDVVSLASSANTPQEKQINETSPKEPSPRLLLHGMQLWLLIAVLYMSVYLLALELTMPVDYNS